MNVGLALLFWKAIFGLAFLYFLLYFFRGMLLKQTPKYVNKHKKHTEKYWQTKISNELNGTMEWRLTDDTRADIVFDNYICEVDWVKKWAEGVGQALHYANETGFKPIVILLSKGEDWSKYKRRVESSGVECWVYDTYSESWASK